MYFPFGNNTHTYVCIVTTSASAALNDCYQLLKSVRAQVTRWAVVYAFFVYGPGRVNMREHTGGNTLNTTPGAADAG